MWNPSSCSNGSHWELHPWFQQQLQSRPKARQMKVNPRLAKAVEEFFHMQHLWCPSGPHSMVQSQSLLKWRKWSPWAWDVPQVMWFLFALSRWEIFLGEDLWLDLTVWCKDGQAAACLQRPYTDMGICTEEPQHIISVSQKPQNKPVTKPLSGFSRTWGLKIGVSEPMV